MKRKFNIDIVKENFDEYIDDIYSAVFTELDDDEE